MPNIRFSYLYRDSGNYKNFGSVVMANPHHYSLAQIAAIIKTKLIDETWFFAADWGLPDLREDIGSDDPTWHEFDGVEFTEDGVNDRFVLL